MDWKKKTITVLIVAFLILSFVMAYVPLLFPSAPAVPNNNDSAVDESTNASSSLSTTITQATSTATSSIATSTQ